jgi:hypothetical protein
MKNKYLNLKTILRFMLLVTAGLFIVVGYYRDEVLIVSTKAINICLECIGIG